MEKANFLKDRVEHLDIKSFDSKAIIEAMRNMSFTTEYIARAPDFLYRENEVKLYNTFFV